MTVQFIAMITEAYDQCILIQPITFEGSNDFTHLFIGLEQAILVMGNFFSNFRDIRIVGWHRNLRAINHSGSAPAQLTSP